MSLCNNRTVDLYLNLSDDERISIGTILCDAASDASISIDDYASELGGYMKLITGIELSAIPYRYNVMCGSLGLTGRSRAAVVPRGILHAHLGECLERIQRALDEPENVEYLVTYLSNRRFLDGLSRAAIDEYELSKLISKASHRAIEKSLKSFLPENDGKCRKVVYSSTRTATGRLTVVEGPQILTIPATARFCIKSAYKNGRVLQIDVISAEPKFALLRLGESVPVDVYDYVSKHILDNAVSRRQAKLITLCALYGQSPKKLKDKLPEGVNVAAIIRQTRKYFGYNELITDLKRQFDDGNLRNAVGRPLECDNRDDHLLISHYLQSSIAEGSLLMFSDFATKHIDQCRPIFVIHDALVVDCQASFADFLLNEGSVELSLGNWIFHAKIRLVGDN